MNEDQSTIHHPAGLLWGAVVRVPARNQFKISMPCENALKERFMSGLKVNEVGLVEFNQRRTEAQSNVEKLVSVIISAQLEQDPKVDVLDEWTVSYALNDEKLCPGLWPVC